VTRTVQLIEESIADAVDGAFDTAPDFEGVHAVVANSSSPMSALR
jgi:hypothetical protein